MILKQYYLECLSQASYLIGDETSGNAVIVDPRRDVQEFLDDASALKLRIVGVINTHFHADFVAGHLEIAQATGAWIGYGSRAKTDYPIRGFGSGQRISLGAVELEILETPGHTWESISILVREHPHDTIPTAVLTGDTLFIGDVGRPDLAAAVGADPIELARAQYRSIHELLMPLPDSVRIFPAHGAGSACGKSLSSALESTIGEQRLTNPSVQPMPRDAFVRRITTGQPAIPDYFSVDALLNRRTRAVMTQAPTPPALTPVALRSLMAAGVAVVDARTPEQFASGHLDGSINVGIDGRFAETAGMVFRPDERIVILADAGRENEVALRFGRIGFDHVVGYLRDPQLAMAGLMDLVRQGVRIQPEELEEVRDREHAVVVDVRNTGERELGAIPDSVHIPLAEIPRRHAELPEGTLLIVHCAGGWRSSVAASTLRTLGHRLVADLEGGYDAWAMLRSPIGA